MDRFDADRIARLERQVARLYQHLGLDPNQEAGFPPAPFADEVPTPAFGGAPGPAFNAAPPAHAFPPQFADAIRRGKTIDAIKIYRQVTGLGLKEAKDAVEAIVRNGGVL